MTFQIFNDDCFKIMKTLPDKSIDIFISDLPYASKNFGKCVACDWDNSINLVEMWKEFKRLRKSKNTPFFFFCNVKHGYDLIRSNPKFFRYEICWIKSGVCGFLNAKKMPLKKTEYIYVFYEKLPFYDISSHKHKFIKSNRKTDNKDLYNINNKYKESYKKYDPPLPNNVIEAKVNDNGTISNKNIYRGGKGKILKRSGSNMYDPPLPNNVIEEKKDLCKYSDNVYMKKGRKKVIEVGKDAKYHKARYDPPLPNNVIEDKMHTLYGEINIKNDIVKKRGNERKGNYDPKLPDNILRIKSQRGKHQTQKPIDIYKWILKYYSKKGWKCFDMTMGSGSCGVACKDMGINFIGIEKDSEIFKVAKDRIENGDKKKPKKKKVKKVSKNIEI